MTAGAISVVGAVSGALAMLMVYFASKKHKEHIEDQDAESSHVTAISAASETLAAAVNVLIQPLNDSIATLQDRERAMAIEMTKMKAQLEIVKADHRRMHLDLSAIVAYVRQLWTQIVQAGENPEPVPENLAHLEWEPAADEYP